MKHLIRSIKYFFYIAVFFCLVVSILFYTSEVPEGATILDLFKEGAWWRILLFFIAFSAVYPLIGFAKKDIYHNGNIVGMKSEIKELFENANFVLESDDRNVMTFRLRNKFLRLMRTYEDAVVIDLRENPAKITGLRKDVLRFSRSIEYMLRKAEE